MKNLQPVSRPSKEVSSPQLPTGRLSVTVGIPTCYGEASILTTVKSILASRDVCIDRISIVADRTPLPPEVRAQLNELGVHVVWNDTEGSQPKKIKQMVDECDTDILVTTQDDVFFGPHTLAEIVRGFSENESVTMVCSIIEPLPPKTFVESILSAAVRVPFRIARLWKKGDNYLSASGRCLSFRTSFIQKFRIPENMVNGDAFLYFENKRLEGIALQATHSIAYIRQPQTLRDQIGPSSRYQIQREELADYFTFDLAPEYRIPLGVGLSAVLIELMRHPVATLLYLPILIYTRIFRQPSKKVFNPLWDLDKSTKDIIHS